MRRGGDYDRWDIEVEIGTLVRARLLMGIEEHGGGAQLVRLRIFQRYSVGGLFVIATLGILVLVAGLNHAGLATFTFVGLLGAMAVRLLWEAALVFGAIAGAVQQSDPGATTLSRPKRRRAVGP